MKVHRFGVPMLVKAMSKLKLTLLAALHYPLPVHVPSPLVFHLPRTRPELFLTLNPFHLPDAGVGGQPSLTSGRQFISFNKDPRITLFGASLSIKRRRGQVGLAGP